VPLAAVLSTAERQYRTVLDDISRTGARVKGADLPAVGEQVAFLASEIQAFADVVWCEQDQCALEFQTPISVEEVKRLRQLGWL
jgi:hypothetical protein